MKEMEAKLSDPENLILQDFELFIEKYFSNEEREELSDHFIENLVDKFSECYKKFLDKSPQEEIPLLTKTLAYFANTNQLQSIALKVAPESEASEGIKKIVQNSLNNYITKKEIGEFIALLRSPYLSGEVKVDLLFFAFSHENFSSAMDQYDLLDAQYEIIRRIFYDFNASSYVYPELKCDIDFLNAFFNNQERQISEDLENSTSRDLSGYLIDAFKQNPEEWINSLEKNTAQIILETSQKHSFFLDLVIEMNNYLINEDNPIESRIKLFNNTFEFLSQMDINFQEHVDFYASHIKFILKHWQEDLGMRIDSEDIRKILKNSMDVFVSNKQELDFDLFVQIMKSSHLSGEIKVDVLFSLYDHPHFIDAMKEVKFLEAQKRMIISIFGDSLGLNEIDFIGAYFDFIKDHKVSKELTDTISEYIGGNQNSDFKRNPDEWIDSLNTEESKIIFELSQTQSDFYDLVNRMSEYLADPGNPLESKVKLFCTTFKELCNVKDVQKYKDVVACYMKFIFEHWQQEDVTMKLQSVEKPFIKKLSEISLLDLSDPTLSETLYNEIIKKDYLEEFKKEGLSDLFNAMKRSILLATINAPGSKELKEEQLVEVLPELLYENLNNFSKMIFIETFDPKKTEEINLPASFSKVIYNQSGYDDDITVSDSQAYELGEPIEKDNLPIGYNIHLPKGEVKGIVVQVYSGNQAKDKNSEMYLPGKLEQFDLDLLNKGYAVVNLNLVNLIKLDVPQSLMPEDLHKEINESIHHFYEVISKNPEKIHSSLGVLKDIPIHLWGASFGGRDAVMHAELYPNTFNSYISFDGALSFEMMRKSDIVDTSFGSSDTTETQKWLDPTNKIVNISDPILLLHNMNDHRINLKVTLDLYKKAKKAGKQELIRLHITEKGPYSKDLIFYTGHFPTKEKESFNAMMDSVTSFLEEGAPALSAAPDWKALRYNCLANKYYRSASLEQRFVSDAYRLAEHKPLNEIYYTLHHLDTLSKDPSKGIDEMKKLKSEGKLTPEVINRMLQSFLAPFLGFIKDEKDIVIPSNLDMNKLLNDPDIQNEIVNKLTSNNTDYQTTHFLISSLYTANPELLKSQFAEYEKEPQVLANLEQAHKKLNAKLEKEKELLTSVQQQTTKNAEAPHKDEEHRKAPIITSSLRSTSSMTGETPEPLPPENTSSKKHKLDK